MIGQDADPSVAGRCAEPRFDSPLARVMFVDRDLPGAVRVSEGQRRLVDRIVCGIEQADEDQLKVLVRLLEDKVLCALSAEAILEVACAIQRRASASASASAGLAMREAPRLAALDARLRRAEEMAGVFGRENLERLSRALRVEAAR